MKKAKRVTLSLPEEMLEAADRAGARERRSRSELMREALRWYLRVQELASEEATPEEIEAIEAGRAGIARGKFVTREELLEDLERDRCEGRARKPEKLSS